jgi:hypothetical protein
VGGSRDIWTKAQNAQKEDGFVSRLRYDFDLSSIYDGREMDQWRRRQWLAEFGPLLNLGWRRVARQIEFRNGGRRLRLKHRKTRQLAALFRLMTAYSLKSISEAEVGNFGMAAPAPELKDRKNR